MSHVVALPLVGVPEIFQGLVGIAGTVVMLLMLIALGGFVYKSLTGGIEWPSDREEAEGGVRRGDEDDEWEFY